MDDETWRLVQARFKANKGRGVGRGNILGRRKPASLLSGVVRCGCCGKNFVICTSGPNSKQRRKGTGRKLRRFACNRARSSGGQLCGNKTTVEMEDLERAALDALEQVILTPEGLAALESQRREFLEEALRESDGEAKRLRTEWKRLGDEESQIIDAIKAGLPLDGLRVQAERVASDRERIQGRLRRIGIWRERAAVRWTRTLTRRSCGTVTRCWTLQISMRCVRH